MRIINHQRAGLPIGTLIVIMMITQTLGWGLSLSLLSVLATPIGRDLQISSTLIYSGATVMYLVGAIASPMAGRLVDRHGGSLVMVAGSILSSIALVTLSFANGALGYLMAWAMHGLAMHLALSTAAYGTIAKQSGLHARRAIGALTLATGLSSTIFWPTTEFLMTWFDWREVCIFYASITMAAAVPANCFLAIRLYDSPSKQIKIEIPVSPPHAVPETSERAFRLLAVAQTLGTAIGTAMGLLMIDMFVALGTPRAGAVFAASLMGFAYLASRGIEVVAGNLLRPMRLAVLVFSALPLSFVPILLWSFSGQPLPIWMAATSAVLYGLPAGLLGILRPSLPFHLFGSQIFGRQLGRLARPADIANALAPSLFALLMTISVRAMIALGIALGMLALVAALRLYPLVASEPQHKPVSP